MTASASCHCVSCCVVWLRGVWHPPVPLPCGTPGRVRSAHTVFVVSKLLMTLVTVSAGCRRPYSTGVQPVLRRDDWPRSRPREDSVAVPSDGGVPVLLLCSRLAVGAAPSWGGPACRPGAGMWRQVRRACRAARVAASSCSAAVRPVRVRCWCAVALRCAWRSSAASVCSGRGFRSRRRTMFDVGDPVRRLLTSGSER